MIFRDYTHSLRLTLSSLDRMAWIERLVRLCDPPLSACSDGSVKRESAGRTRPDRADYVPLELLGRIFAGTGAWLGGPGGSDAVEDVLRGRMRESILSALVAATSSDPALRFNFSRGDQPLVDAALLVLGLFRAGPDLWDSLDRAQQQSVLIAIEETRSITPWNNNWLLFPALIEAFLASKGRRHRPAVIRKALHHLEKWYRGDGIYSDGDLVGVDYYNSSTIHPLLLTLVDVDRGSAQIVPKRLQSLILSRAQRHAETLERMIGVDGAFPALGRSITYRCGAFHLLAQLAWRSQLPKTLSPGRVRGCLGAVIRWTLDAENTFDENGWLRVGLRGCQPDLAESYISVGSGYFCLNAFLPLGLPSTDLFWKEPVAAWTAVRLQQGQSPGCDRKIARSLDGGDALGFGTRCAGRWSLLLDRLQRWRHPASRRTSMK
jgi:hypothetical protein